MTLTFNPGNVHHDLYTNKAQVQRSVGSEWEKLTDGRTDATGC